MKAARLNKFQAADSVVVADIEKPVITNNCVLVDICAASVNPVDWKIRDGYMQPTLPITMGGDFSGVVIDVGKNALAYVPGDEVYGGASVFRNGSGAFAQCCCADISTISFKPKYIDHIQAAAFPLAGLSALQALTEHMRLSKGQKVLVHGGAGGIGHIAIQIAKNIGAYVATTVSTADVDFVKQLGADEVIDYRKEQFETKINNFDRVFDTVGGDIYKKSFKVLHKGGLIVSMIAPPDEELMKQNDINSITMQTRITTDQLDKLTSLIDDEKIKVHVDKVFSLEQACDALSYLKDQHTVGKVVLKIK